MFSRFLFRPIDARQYAALRIAFGALTFLTLCGWIGVSTFHFSNAGWFPVRRALEVLNPDEWTLLYTITSPVGVKLFFIFALLSSAAMTIGLLTRVTSWLTFICFVSVFCRNRSIIYGGDMVIRVMLFYIALCPAGLRWSLDAVLRRMRRDDAPVGRFRPGAAVRVPIWQLRLMQFQLCAIYFTTGIAKMHGEDWWSGEAIQLVLLNGIFIQHDMSWVRDSRIAQAVLKLMSWVTLFWETFFPLLMLHRWTRWVGLAVGVMVHGGIILLIRIHWFGEIMISSYLSFLPDGLFRRVGILARRWCRQQFEPPALLVRYDARSPSARRVACFLSAVDILGRLRFDPKGPRQVAIRDRKGQEASGLAALELAGRSVPLLTPLRLCLKVPGVRPFLSWAGARA